MHPIYSIGKKNKFVALDINANNIYEENPAE